MPESDADHVRALVGTLLAQAGLGPVPEGDLTVIAASYPVLRAAADSLYRVPEVRYASPATRFAPDATFAAWD